MTKVEKIFFERITSGDPNLVVLDSEIFNIKVKVICLLEDKATNRLVQPMGIIVNDEIFKLLKEPEPDQGLKKVVILKKKKVEKKKKKPRGNA